LRASRWPAASTAGETEWWGANRQVSARPRPRYAVRGPCPWDRTRAALEFEA